MDQHLYKFLMINGHLALPQLGRIAVVQQSARYNEDDGTLQAPRPILLFSADESQLADRQLLSFLARETGDDETVVTEAFLSFIRSFKEMIAEKGKAAMEGVGIFTRGEHNDVHFQSGVNIDYLLPGVHVEQPEIAEEVVEETKDPYWWYYALILLILGLGALAYYYI